MTTTLTDADVRAGLTATSSVDTMREVVLAAHRGELVAPARSVTDLGEGRLLLTVGRWRARWLGYRSYDTFDRDHPDARDDHVVVVHDDVTAELGRRRRRTGPAAAKTLGLVGTGRQAWTQLWAISAVRKLDTVRVYSRETNHVATRPQSGRARNWVSPRPQHRRLKLQSRSPTS